MLRNMLRWMRITKSSADNKQFPAHQMEYLGKVADGANLNPYGVHTNIPADVLVLGASVQGNPDNRVALGVLPKSRPKLEEGEVAFYHPKTGAFIIWREGGNLEIVTDGNIDITAETITVNATTINANADVNFVGALTSNGKNISDTHSHSQPNDSGGNSEANTSGVI